MDFGDAIRALKQGHSVAREGWNGKNMFLAYMPRLELPPFNTQGTARKVNDRTAKWIGEDQPLDCNPYIAMYTADKKWQPGWLASQTDMLAEDWVVVHRNADVPEQARPDGANPLYDPEAEAAERQAEGLRDRDRDETLHGGGENADETGTS